MIYKNLDLSDRFLISNTGKLYSKISNKILKTQINKEGYEIVCVSLGSRNNKKILRMHVAVAYMFVDGYRDDFVVNHKDGNKLNNNFNNLEWVTRKENMRHAVDTGLLKEFQKSPVKQIDPQTNKIIKIFESIADAHKYLNKPPYNGYIYAAVRKMDKTAYGYKWEYI